MGSMVGLIAASLLSFLIAPVESRAVCQSSANPELLSFTRELEAAYTHADVARMQQLIGSNYFATGPSGKIMDKASWIAGLSRSFQENAYDFFGDEDVCLRQFSATSSAREYRLIERGRTQGRAFTNYFRVTEVYEKEKSGWSVVGAHLSLFQPTRDGSGWEPIAHYKMPLDTIIPSQNSSGGSAARIQALEKTFAEAIRTQNAKILAAILDTEYLGLETSGSTMGKADGIEQALRVPRVETPMGGLLTRTFGDMAIVSGLFEIHEGDRNPISKVGFLVSRTDVWIRRSSRWTLIQQHESLIAKDIDIPQ